MKQESTPKRTISYEIKKEKGIDFIYVRTSDKFSVTFTDLGASIYEIKFNDELMTLTPKYVSDFKRKDIYHGKTIGRYANRIKDAKIFVAGESYNLEANEGTKCLHSGSQGLSNKYFDYEIIDKNDKFFYVHFSYTSKHLEAGFPGELKLHIYYILTYEENDFSLCLKMFASTDYETLFRPTNHTYFTLGEESLNTLKLSLYKFDKYVIPDKDMLPKEIRKVDGLNFINKIEGFDNILSLPEIKESVPKGLDHYFLKEKDTNSFLLLLSSKYALSVYCDFEGVHLYSDGYPIDVEFKNTNYVTEKGLAIEPCDSPLKKNILKPGEHFERYIIYAFSKVR